MGIYIVGKAYDSKEEAKADIEELSKLATLNVQSLKKAESEAWAAYVGFQDKSKLMELKAVYIEALQKRKSLDWAMGKAEGLGLKPDEIVDSELEDIRSLFN